MADIPRSHRSKIDRLQLGLVVKEKLLKKYGPSKIYKVLIDDMKILEEGILVNNPSKNLVKCGFLIHCADNLEASLVGGFSSCFSSKDICHICHAQYDDLTDHIHDFDGSQAHNYWTIQEYDNIMTIKENDINGQDSGSESDCGLDTEITEDNLFDEIREPDEECTSDEEDISDDRMPLKNARVS